ncbi:MAG TPA: hypothetical protein VN903_00670 [Polyangia bacterium]|nr:hypothetical protein [Polyangia bacterium]
MANTAQPAAERQYRWADERREEFMTPLEENLRAFFQNYARTFHQDLNNFCDLYEIPSETVRLDGLVQRFDTKGTAVEFFTLAKKRYEEEGCAQWGIRGFVVEDRGGGRARATIDWDMKDANGMPIRGWRQTYDVIGGPIHWKVQHSTLHAGSEVAYPGLPNQALQTDGASRRR